MRSFSSVALCLSVSSLRSKPDGAAKPGLESAIKGIYWSIGGLAVDFIHFSDTHGGGGGGGPPGGGGGGGGPAIA